MLRDEGIRLCDLQLVPSQLVRREENHSTLLGKNPECQEIVGYVHPDQVGKGQVPGRNGNHVRRAILRAKDRDEQATGARSG